MEVEVKDPRGIVINTPQGEQGDQGIQGEQGLPGPKGERGDQGPIGEQGETGDQGLPGLPGNPGEQGDPGLKGLKGEQGDPGLKGLKGEQGDQGPTGATGAKGLPGDPGLKGPIGDTGLKGPVGDKGLPGDPGLKGPVGDTGPKGEQGDPGLKGEQGDPGLKGPTGDTGPTGLKGEQGDPGLKGEQGDPGLKGEQGDPGLKGPIGDTGAKGAQGNQGGRGLPGIQGPKGPEGNQGPTGQKGEQGDPGPKGPKGDALIIPKFIASMRMDGCILIALDDAGNELSRSLYEGCVPKITCDIRNSWILNEKPAGDWKFVVAIKNPYYALVFNNNKGFQRKDAIHEGERYALFFMKERPGFYEESSTIFGDSKMVMDTHMLVGSNHDLEASSFSFIDFESNQEHFLDVYKLRHDETLLDNNQIHFGYIDGNFTVAGTFRGNIWCGTYNEPMWEPGGGYAGTTYNYTITRTNKELLIDLENLVLPKILFIGERPSLTIPVKPDNENFPRFLKVIDGENTYQIEKLVVDGAEMEAVNNSNILNERGTNPRFPALKINAFKTLGDILWNTKSYNVNIGGSNFSIPVVESIKPAGITLTNGESITFGTTNEFRIDLGDHEGGYIQVKVDSGFPGGTYDILDAGGAKIGTGEFSQDGAIEVPSEAKTIIIRKFITPTDTSRSNPKNLISIGGVTPTATATPLAPIIYSRMESRVDEVDIYEVKTDRALNSYARWNNNGVSPLYPLDPKERFIKNPPGLNPISWITNNRDTWIPSAFIRPYTGTSMSIYDEANTRGTGQVGYGNANNYIGSHGYTVERIGKSTSFRITRTSPGGYTRPSISVLKDGRMVDFVYSDAKDAHDLSASRTIGINWTKGRANVSFYASEVILRVDDSVKSNIEIDINGDKYPFDLSDTGDFDVGFTPELFGLPKDGSVYVAVKAGSAFHAKITSNRIFDNVIPAYHAMPGERRKFWMVFKTERKDFDYRYNDKTVKVSKEDAKVWGLVGVNGVNGSIPVDYFLCDTKDDTVIHIPDAGNSLSFGEIGGRLKYLPLPGEDFDGDKHTTYLPFELPVLGMRGEGGTHRVGQISTIPMSVSNPNGRYLRLDFWDDWYIQRTKNWSISYQGKTVRPNGREVWLEPGVTEFDLVVEWESLVVPSGQQGKEKSVITIDDGYSKNLTLILVN